MEEVYQFLRDNTVFYVATLDGDRPRVRPFGLAMIYENRLYFGTGAHKKVFQQLNVNPRVEICTVSPQNQWLRLHGQAVFDSRPETVARIFEVSPMLKTMYNEDTGWEMRPFYLEGAVAEFCDMSGNYREIKF